MKYGKIFLAFLWFLPRIGAGQSHTLTVLSYNVMDGFSSDSIRMRDYTAWVQQIRPDIICYQELNHFTQKKLENFAIGYGHPYAVLSKESGYPVGITSRYPIVNVQKVVDNMWHAYIYAQIKGYHVFAIHFSPHQYRKRQLEVAEIVAHIQTLPKKSRVLIAGDFNSLSAKDSAKHTVSFVHQMQEEENKRSIVRNLDNGRPDYSVTGALEENGLVDSYWKANHKNTLRFQAGPPHRIDYIFTSKNIASKILSCDFIVDSLTRHLSDHKPLLLHLKD